MGQKTHAVNLMSLINIGLHIGPKKMLIALKVQCFLNDFFSEIERQTNEDDAIMI